ncbi:MAG TPA: glycosyltransferase [Gemmataceae bacterium]|nr:glycosyltransferase [Gemmataceae bacterium]
MAQPISAVSSPSRVPTRAPSYTPVVPPDVAALQEEIVHLADLKSRLEGALVQMQAANAKLQADEMVQRQRLETARAFIQALLASSTWKITAPIRFLRNLLRPRGCNAAHLVPLHHIEAAPNEPAGTWRACGHDPQFVVHCWMEPGWIRVRIHLHSPEKTQFNLFADYGEGFSENTCIERLDYAGEVHTEFFFRLERPIFALRLDPRESEGNVRMEAFEARPVPAPQLFKRRVRETLRRFGEGRRAGRPLLGLFADLSKGKLTPALARPQKKTQENQRDAEYQQWFEHQRLNDAERAQMRDEAGSWTPAVLFSVLMPVHDVVEEYLRAAIESVCRQFYPHWELCIALDGVKSARLRLLLEDYERRDERIHVAYLAENRGVSAASNAALDLARGDFVALLDHDDELAEDALWRIAKSLAADPDADMLYSDEDKLTLDDKHVQPHFKPGWSPELLLSYMYTCHLGVYRTELVRQVGGFRSAFDQAQDYDLALRVAARSGRVRHVPGVLYHWRMLPTSTATSAAAKPRAHEAARRALEAHLTTTGQAGRVEPGALQGLFRVRFAIVGRPLVSIIIPTACSKALVRNRSVYLLANCLTTIRRNSTYSNVEIIVIDNGDMPDDLRREIASCDVRRLTFSGELNLSAKLNQGAAEARGEHLVFLNDDTEIISPDWLEALLEYSQQPQIGAVGAKLYFADDRLQHVGVMMQDGLPVHQYHRSPPDHPGYFGSNLVVRNYGAVTGACFMTPAEVFKAAGGFDEAFVLTHSDIDYCLRIAAAGKRCVFTPHAELYHFESVSRAEAPAWEAKLFRDRWRALWSPDPYGNPHLIPSAPGLHLNLHCWLNEERARLFDREGTPITVRHLQRAGIELWEPAAAEVAWGVTGAARWVLGLLLQDPVLRTRFPRTLCNGADGVFPTWVREKYANEPSASPRGKANLEALFQAPPGNVVRQIYDHSVEVRRHHPMAETPGGRWRFLRWLLVTGMPTERLSLEQVLWFFLETEHDAAGKLVRAYRINPDWQERFPLALTCFGRHEFLRSLGEEQGLHEAAWFRDLELPDTHSALDELRLLVAARPDLREQHPEAFDDDQRLAELVASLPRVDEAWLARLQDEVTQLGLRRPGVNLFGHFCYASGLNVALTATETSLRQLGAAIARRDVPCEARNNVTGRDAYLDLEVHDVTLLHIAPQPMLDYFYPLSGLRLRPGVARVAVWYWELESAPAAWKVHARHLEEIWAPTRFIAKALEPVMPKAVVWMPPGLALPAFAPRPREAFNLPTDEFVFLTMFDMTSGAERKNPFGAIEAFRQAFRPEEPVRLVLKTSRGSYNRTRWTELQEAARTAGRVTVLDTILTRSDTLALMASADAYISLHRSEGFGLTLAESMLLGKPVVATGYSGNMDFMTADNSYLVDYQIVPITDKISTYERGMCWAEPSVEHAARQMRSIYEDRSRAQAIGELARVEVQQTLDPQAAGQRMLERLAQIRSGRTKTR